MSQRLGPADGRAYTISTSSKLFNNLLMNINDVPVVDNYSYRQLLQKQGPAIMKPLYVYQSNGDKNGCFPGNKVLIKAPNLY